MNVILKGKTKAIAETMVEEGYANTQSEAIRLALVDFEQRHLGEVELVNRKLDKIDHDIKVGKRKLLNASEAMGSYSKHLKWYSIPYRAAFDEDWPKYFSSLDHSTKERVAKKIQKILEFPQKRHLKKGAQFFVDEAGSDRITYRVFEQNKEVRFYFVGNHKDYEKWYRQFFWKQIGKET